MAIRAPLSPFVPHGARESYGSRKSTNFPGPRAANHFGMRALVKLVTSWVKVPPVELDGSRSKRCIRDEAVKPNHKRDNVWNCRVVTKVNLI